MTFTQRIQPTCDEHGDSCSLIDCVTDTDVTDEEGNVIHPAGAVVWASHLDSSVHPEHRLNPDHPAVGVDGNPVTMTAWCETCLATPAGERYGSA